MNAGVQEAKSGREGKAVQEEDYIKEKEDKVRIKGELEYGEKADAVF